MDTFKIIGALPMSGRIAVLKKEMLDESRWFIFPVTRKEVLRGIWRECPF